MARRGAVLALLLILVAQFTAPVAFSSVCLEPCPDDTEGSNCPPVCSLCTSCTHAQQAIVDSAVVTAPAPRTLQAYAAQLLAAPSHLADDVFHVPLLG